MSEVDIAHLRKWIGKTEVRSDILTSGLVERLRATIGDMAPDGLDAVPLAVHWCLAPPAVPPAEIGRDGHPARGGFLPPVPLPRRMWAGGALHFHRPLEMGDTVTRSSRIADVSEKVGRSGRLVFVTVEHEISTGTGAAAITERQDIVYREAQAGSAQQPASSPRPDAWAAGHRHVVEATTTLLFRYSALTFNGHRIHYDRDYARDVEGYPGLVVHGPLQATLLVNLAARLESGHLPKIFTYRGLSPLFDGAAFTVNATRGQNGMALWCADRAGVTTMEANAEFDG
ncbi:MAG TPA: MaoC family dehydratase N-terminal domain-containing protein [Rhizobiaceae bacterium]|nr:MaoC family dehydratase N-terminal domain-containing protein [Rhizobiaceae bacterium]